MIRAIANPAVRQETSILFNGVGRGLTTRVPKFDGPGPAAVIRFHVAFTGAIIERVGGCAFGYRIAVGMEEGGGMEG